MKLWFLSFLIETRNFGRKFRLGPREDQGLDPLLIISKKSRFKTEIIQSDAFQFHAIETAGIVLNTKIVNPEVIFRGSTDLNNNPPPLSDGYLKHPWFRPL